MIGESSTAEYSSRMSMERDASRSTLHGDDTTDIPLQERSEKDPNSKAKTDDIVRTTEEPAGQDVDVLVVDWEGPNDPQNPKK